MLIQNKIILIFKHITKKLERPNFINPILHKFFNFEVKETHQELDKVTERRFKLFVIKVNIFLNYLKLTIFDQK